ncbi:hypothetical protein CLOHYLEM_07532 [[Clostridium] hylemonae DSM 15053]|uniref:Uncharacterized protein n=1 Tax=[Clostridium] hylemonae DSM 15053 TaxID=553973 RepID=C0C5Z5_9FIRM|nr:hypothetical protein CLOHYLEM_07532 [[Clostridium] hylemonae DSM 15053]
MHGNRGLFAIFPLRRLGRRKAYGKEPLPGMPVTCYLPVHMIE